MKFVDQIVGLFIIFAIVALIAGIIFIGINQRLFQKNYSFKSKFTSGSGLTLGMPVNLHGVAIGKLTKMKLDPETLFVNVEFYIEDTYYPKVALPNSVIELVSAFGLTNQLVFHPGKIMSQAAVPVDEGSYIPSNQTEEGQTLEREELVVFESSEETLGALIAKINPIVSQLQPILLSVRRISVMLEDGLRGRSTNEIGKLLVNINESLRGSQNTPGGEMMSNLAGVTAKLNESLASMEIILKDVSKMTSNPRGLIVDLIDPKGSFKTMLDDNNALYNNLDGTLSNTRQIMEDLKRITGAMAGTAPQLTTIVDDVNKTLGRVNDVLEALKNNPLLQGGVPKEKEQPSTFQGLRDNDF